MYSPTKVGKRLRELREKKGKTQNDVAEALGVTRSAIGAYENGIRTPNPDMMIRLAQYFGKSISYIFFDRNPTK